MTIWLLLTSPSAPEKNNRDRGCVGVISVVVPRPSSISNLCGSLAKFRSWREGTDPAMRGSKGWRGAWRVTGGAI